MELSDPSSNTSKETFIPGTQQWYALWAILFLNVTAGISIISQAAPMAGEITGVPPLVAAGMVGIISIANGVGRLLWAWLSDAVGRPVCS